MSTQRSDWGCSRGVDQSENGAWGSGRGRGRGMAMAGGRDGENDWILGRRGTGRKWMGTVMEVDGEEEGNDDDGDERDGENDVSYGLR